MKAIETVNHDVAAGIEFDAGKYSLMKKRLRRGLANRRSLSRSEPESIG